jgi:hypothetical protein
VGTKSSDAESRSGNAAKRVPTHVGTGEDTWGQRPNTSPEERPSDGDSGEDAAEEDDVTVYEQLPDGTRVVLHDASKGRR